MKKRFVAAIIVLSVAVSGCAIDARKYVDLYYTGEAESTPPRSGTVGISSFVDTRPGSASGYVGVRYIGKRGKETYLAYGDDLAMSITGIARSFIQDEGYTPMSIPRWEYSPEGVREAGQRFKYLVGGDIKKLDCLAVKKMGVTSMALDIEIVFYVGDPLLSVLRTRPYKLKLERTELAFSEKKLENFLNESLLEIVQKALSLEADPDL